jgi:hypothetical protein
MKAQNLNRSSLKIAKSETLNLLKGGGKQVKAHGILLRCIGIVQGACGHDPHESTILEKNWDKKR